MKNSSTAGSHRSRNASPLFLRDAMRRLAARAKRINSAMPDEASTATQIGYTRAGHGAYIAARARNIVIGETRFPTAIQGKTVMPPRKVNVARAFCRSEPWGA